MHSQSLLTTDHCALLTRPQLSCILSAASSIIGCSSGDFACLCTSSASVGSAAQKCIIGCGVATALQVQSAARAVCSCEASLGASITSSSTSRLASESSASLVPAPTTPSSFIPISTPGSSSSSSQASSSSVITGGPTITSQSAASPTPSLKSGQGSIEACARVPVAVFAFLGGLMILL